MDLKDKGVLVSGGASGLGAACIRLLHSAGARVVIADLNAEGGQALAAELGERAQFVQTNVTDEAQVQAAVQTAVDGGGLHVAISCAGIGVAERVVGKDGPHSLASFNKVIQVNLIGTFNVIRLASAAMSTNQPSEGGERGVLINTASVAA